MADIALLSAFLNQLIREMTQHEAKPVIKGLDEKLENLEKNLRAVEAVLKDAEKRQWNDDKVKLWMEDLNDMSYDAINVFDEWSTMFLRSQESGDDQNAYSFATKIKVCLSVLGRYFRSSPLNRASHFLKITHKIENINERLDEIAARKDRFNFSKTITRHVNEPRRPNFSPSIVDVPFVYGWDEHKQTVLDRLLSGKNEESEGLCVVSIVGMGGIGKTALAKLVYNNDRVKADFDVRAWVSVSEPFDRFEIAKEVVQQLRGVEISTDVDQREMLMMLFLESIKGKKFLLVLDDVCADDLQEWGPLENDLRSGAVGSRVVVTTRKKEVVQMMGEKSLVCMEELSEKCRWLLFKEIAFFEKSDEEKEDLKQIGEKIVAKCKGLPLAVKILGSLLRGKSKEEWQHVLQSDLWKLERVKFEKAKKNFLSPLLLSYYDLDPTEKRCFTYCAIFPKDYLIDVEDLIRQWKAQGYLTCKNQMEDEGQRCYDMLALRSFFRDFEYGFDGRVKRCKMHDIVHDFVQFIASDEFSTIARTDAPNVDLFKARHLRFSPSFDGQLPISILKKKNLHTLFVVKDEEVRTVQPQFFHLRCLRTLSLNNCYIQELPKNIDELILLRYLDLSRNNLRSLPTTIGNLYNLQTLLLYYCGRRVTSHGFPKQISKLTNLQMFSIQYRIKPFSNDKFVLQDLKRLNNLRDIALHDLEAYEHVNEPLLTNNMNLNSLELQFTKPWIHSDEIYHKSVVEALQPNPNLQHLTINKYMGVGFPNWMITLTNLKSLCLSECFNCKSLPPLGRLQSLETLELRDFYLTRKVGPEFLGAEIENDTTMIESHDGLNFFPKLKRLLFGLFCEEWEGIPGWNVDSPVRIMPHLEHLKFRHCTNLKALPDFLQRTPLKHLISEGCYALEECCRKKTGKEWAKIQHVTNIQIIPRNYFK